MEIYERIKCRDLLNVVLSPLEVVEKHIPRRGTIACSGMAQMSTPKVIPVFLAKYVEDRTKLFDNYIPCIKDGCDEKHAENLLKSIMIMLNETWINGRVKAKEFIEKTLPIIEVMKHA
jgi:acyl-CoA hydrolase